ncbi:hypothetical protein B0H17DRAFT_1139856 [Mycena rosella]|uniref:Uncharacterized protein n=1 Tax=Mycena rosella TaxID=1033263 RepID=A0AAD7G817_MYCRO|nr:hypothetical protein B0H17DRAFT_1139856 [Mycena rosella]
MNPNNFNPLYAPMPDGLRGFGPNASYLLGLGPLPAPTQQQAAVAMMQTALDSDMFDQHQMFEEDEDEENENENEHEDFFARGHRYSLLADHCPSPEPSVPHAHPQVPPQGPASLITVKVPVYGAVNKDKKAPTVNTTLVLPSDIPATDFFSRIHAQMNVDPTTAVLGWKESAERRRDPYHRLASAEDLNGAFKSLIKLQTSTRRKKDVIMEVVNLEVQPDGKTTKQAEKQSETALSIPELQQVQAKLKCAEHPGKNRWCYVMGPKSTHPGKHVELGIDVVSLWARKMHDGDADPDCVEPPSILRLDELAKRGRTREERNTRGRGQPTLPLSTSTRALHPVDDNTVKSKKRPHADLSSDEADSDDDDTLLISDVLRELQAKFPALDYLQYANVLQAQGIVYASSALDFDHAYYKATVGMADGAIGMFIKKAKKMVKDTKKAKGKKRARVDSESDKEN